VTLLNIGCFFLAITAEKQMFFFYFGNIHVDLTVKIPSGVFPSHKVLTKIMT